MTTPITPEALAELEAVLEALDVDDGHDLTQMSAERHNDVARILGCVPALLASARRLGEVQAMMDTIAHVVGAVHDQSTGPSYPGDSVEVLAATRTMHKHLTTANARVAELTQRAEELTDALHRDRTGLAAALGRVVESVKGRMWVTEGRGAYEWDDDRYKAEAGAALREAMGIALQALRDSGTIVNKALNGREPKPEGERDRAYIVTLTASRDALAAKLAEVERALNVAVESLNTVAELGEDADASCALSRIRAASAIAKDAREAVNIEMRTLSAPEAAARCSHPNVTPYRAEFIDPYGKRGPSVTRTVAWEKLVRSWATCLDCGVRLERAVLG